MKLFVSAIAIIVLSVSKCAYSAPMDLSSDAPLSSASNNYTSPNSTSEIADAAKSARALFGMRKQGLITSNEFQARKEQIIWGKLPLAGYSSNPRTTFSSYTSDPSNAAGPSNTKADTTNSKPDNQPANVSVSQKLRELHALRKEGLFSESEFQKRKNELLEQY